MELSSISKCSGGEDYGDYFTMWIKVCGGVSTHRSSLCWLFSSQKEFAFSELEVQVLSLLLKVFVRA